MNEDLQKQMRALLDAPRPPSLQGVRDFLVHYAHDADRELLERQVRYLITLNVTIPINAVEAIEDVLLSEHPPGTLHDLVRWEGNEMLDEDSDIAAAAWLRQLAADLREWLGQYAPPPRDANPR